MTALQRDRRAAKMRGANISTFRRKAAAIKGWRTRRRRIIKRLEDWCLDRVKGAI